MFRRSISAPRVFADDADGQLAFFELPPPTDADVESMIHTCALLAGGSVRCWGGGAYGRLGYSDRFGFSLCRTDDSISCNVGDDEAPACAGDVRIGLQISAERDRLVGVAGVAVDAQKPVTRMPQSR